MMVILTLFIITLLLAVVVLLDRDNDISTSRVSVERINRLLPQTQCGECGYGGCRPYATAIANGEADINRCPPGGDITIQNLSHLTGHPGKPLAADLEPAVEGVAVIDEDLCIGCVKCIRACPVDAIVGAPKLMHTVIEAECTGCKLCIPPCPVDCISMVKPPLNLRDWHWAKPVNILAK